MTFPLSSLSHQLMTDLDKSPWAHEGEFGEN